MTNDYSTGLYNEGVNDIYHSAFGALTEAYEKFINPLNIKTYMKDKMRLNVLDICYGIGYNTKALLNEILTLDISGKEINIDCVDNDKILIELSPFISSRINLLKRIKAKKYLRKNVESYNEAKKIVNLKTGINKTYKIHDLVNKILIKNLINEYGHDFLSEESKKIMAKNENHAFFDLSTLKFYKFLLNFEVILHLKQNKSTFVHNIYYKNISKRIIDVFKKKHLDNIGINFCPKDIREYLKETDKEYDIVFLDGFTPSKCPCIWSEEFFNKLYTLMSADSILVTYNSSAPVRNAMQKAGFYIGNTLNNKKDIIGTIAAKNEIYIKHGLTEKQKGLLNTKSGIPYRDENLLLDNDTILLNRKNEFDSSDLISASQYLKKNK